MLVYVQKNLIPTSSGFNVIALQIYREILKEYRKRAMTLQKYNFQKFEIPVSAGHMRNVMPVLKR